LPAAERYAYAEGYAEAALWCLCVLRKRVTSASSKSWIGRERSISTNNKRAGEKKAGPVIRVKARRRFDRSQRGFPERFKRRLLIRDCPLATYGAGRSRN
jgi:hypothetical protein